MLEITTALPISAPATPPANGPVNGAAPAAPSGSGAVGEPFAAVLAGIGSETSPGPHRQDLAAPGKTAFAALPPGGDAVVARDVPPQSPALNTRPVPARVAPLVPELLPAALPGAEVAAPAVPADDLDERDVPPVVAGFVTVAVPLPQALPLGAGGGDAPPLALPIQLVAPGVAAVTAGTAPAPIADPVLPVAASGERPPVARRLSLKLDPVIEVVDAGSPRAASAADQPRTTSRFAATEPATAVPLAIRPAAVATAGVAVPAAHAFAHAIAQAARRADTRDDSAAIDPTDITTAAQALAAVDARPVVVAPRALDMAREDWPQRLIDRIEAARDAANAGDTRIRLVPEALGKIDIALRQDGNTLHVQFTAEQAATRDLLASAQSRLADLAEARGLRLGQTGVDGGTGTGAGTASGEQGRRQPAASAPLANRPASDLRAETTTSGSDNRIA